MVAVFLWLVGLMGLLFVNWVYVYLQEVIMLHKRNRMEIIGFSIIGVGLLIWGCMQVDFVVNVFLPESATDFQRDEFESTTLQVATAPLCIVGFLVYKMGQKRNRVDFMPEE